MTDDRYGRTWNVFAGVQHHVVHDVRVVDERLGTDHVIVGVIRQIESLAYIRRFVCRYRRLRETQRRTQQAYTRNAHDKPLQTMSRLYC